MGDNLGKFIYAYDDYTRDKLSNDGYDFIQEINYKGKKAYLFENNKDKLSFTDGNLEFSNKLCF